MLDIQDFQPFKPDSESLPLNFRIKGPVGLGIGLKSSGVHVAFCGGTGTLVFLDLVSNLLIRNYFLMRDKSNMPDYLKSLKNDFVFRLYVSVPDIKSFVGLELCEALLQANKKLGISNFQLKVRISKLTKGWDNAWDQAYIEKEMA